MSNDISNNKYRSSKIPERQQLEFADLPCNAQIARSAMNHQSAHQAGEKIKDSFYVIDYSLSDVQGTGKFVLKSQKVKPPENEAVYESFNKMKQLARDNRMLADSYRFYDKSARENMARVFYLQGLSMEDFSDNYSANAPFSSYYPLYQALSYEQFRTYFTWRSKVRQGEINETSLSYAFLYIYELLNQIGVDNPQDGIDQLYLFWQRFRAYNQTIDKYVIKWIKDYHIYYPLEQSLIEFIHTHQIDSFYPKVLELNAFDLLCSISKYDIRKSNFFTEHNSHLIKGCVTYVIDHLKQVCTDHDISFDNMLFQPDRKLTLWQPFRDALFYPRLKQADRRIILSDNEFYICVNNTWMTSTMISSNAGRHLAGFILKKIEADLRCICQYKYKLNAQLDNINHPLIEVLSTQGLSMEKIISHATSQFYKEATKKVVKVDHDSLFKIRQEAIETQEKLIVPEQPSGWISQRQTETSLDGSDKTSQHLPTEKLSSEDAFEVDVINEPDLIGNGTLDIVPAAFSLEKTAGDSSPNPILGVNPLETKADVKPHDLKSDGCTDLMQTLSAIELNILKSIVENKNDIKQIADSNHIMLEVLVDSINEKAIDMIGDHLLDNDFNIYDDYMNLVKEMMS